VTLSVSANNLVELDQWISHDTSLLRREVHDQLRA
jgi:hypothetical protein